MSKRRHYFGTDGVRGRVGTYPITPDFVLKLGWAAGSVLAKEQKTKKVLIGKDTRISGYMFESALEAGLSAAGMDIYLLGPMPTPAIAYLTRTFRAQAGVVISASHNPFYDNGIKFFSSEGTKLSDDIELAIEKQIDQPMRLVESSKLGKAVRVKDAVGRYIEFCKSTAPISLSLKGLKIVVDCAQGATYQVAPAVFRELGAEVIEISVDPDGLNINEYCGATKPDALKRMVIAEEADLGIALDGDGDRVIMVDHKGHVVDGDEIIYIIARFLKNRGLMKGGVVGTLMSNFGFERALCDLGVPFVRSEVGDRYVMEKLLEHNWTLGGENSGHIICLDVTTTGDGIVSAIQVLSAMVDSGKSLFELKQGMEMLPQVLINVKIAQKVNLDDHPEIQKAVNLATEKLGDRGRVLLRPSGTEPLIRVMVESYDQAQTESLAKELAEVVQRTLV